MKIAIIGAGAAGTFCAIRIKEELVENNLSPDLVEISLFEKGRTPLRKVKISGGGRCNVTHALFSPKEMVAHYPRGNKELLGPFHQFCSGDMLSWLDEKGIRTKIEDDGRIFPVSDDSQTIIDCFQQCLDRYHIAPQLSCGIKDIKKVPHESFQVLQKDGTLQEYDVVIIATGSDKDGHFLAQSLGHSITELAPSLFTFKCPSPFLKGLAGISFKSVSISLGTQGKKFHSQGPLLITHWGLSGPAILKLSAWAARGLKSVKYQFSFFVNFLEATKEQTLENLKLLKKENSAKKVKNTPSFGISKRFWERVIEILFANESELKWADFSNQKMGQLASFLTQAQFESEGSHRFKEEFVECGGIDCKEVNFKSFESKINPNLYFAGEILDIDGITGGFNFQNAWSGAYIIAKNIVKKL